VISVVLIFCRLSLIWDFGEPLFFDLGESTKGTNNAKTEWEPATCLLLVFVEIHVGCRAAMPMAGLLFLQDHQDSI